MNQRRNIFSFAIFIFLGAISFFVFTNGQGTRTHRVGGYPPPATNEKGVGQEKPYPAPKVSSTAPAPVASPTKEDASDIPWKSILSHDPTLAARLTKEPNLAADISHAATQLAQMREASAKSSANPTEYHEKTYPVNSVNDLKNVIKELDIGDKNCYQKGAALSPVFVEAISPTDLGYYVVPVQLGEELCSEVHIQIKEGQAKLLQASELTGKKITSFPLVTSEKARFLIEEKTGQKVKEDPKLVHQYLISPPTKGPFWKVITEKEDVYYIFFTGGPTEEKPFELLIEIRKKSEVRENYKQ